VILGVACNRGGTAPHTHTHTHLTSYTSIVIKQSLALTKMVRPDSFTYSHYL